MKVYPTHEDRRAILERRLEIAREKNHELKAANQALREALAPFARIHDEQHEAGNLDGTSSSLELWVDENDLERAAHVFSVTAD